METLGGEAGLLPKRMIESDRPPATDLAIEQVAIGDVHAEHFFQTESLGAELDPVPIVFFFSAAFVLDRPDPIRMELHHVGLSGQPQGKGSDRHRKFGPDPLPCFMALDVNPVVHDSAFCREPVFGPFPLHMNEGALPLAEQDVLKPGEREQVGFRIHDLNRYISIDLLLQK